MAEGIAHVYSVFRRPSGLSGLACAPSAEQVDCWGRESITWALGCHTTQAANAPHSALY